MASTRNKNTINDFKLEQRNNILDRRTTHQAQTMPYPYPPQQPCYPNKPNFVGVPSIQIVNVESCRSRRKTSSKS